MTLPGYEVDLVQAPPSVSQLTESGVMFAIGHGLNAVSIEQIFSTDDFVAAAGARQPASPMFDALDSYFHEGGYTAYISTAPMASNDAAIVALLENFQEGLGIGQLSAPGLTSQAVQQAVASAAVDLGRVAVLDGIDTATVATLTAQAALITSQTDNSPRFAAMFAPWDITPGLASGTTRTVPPSGRICGNIARNDQAGLSVNSPAAGPNGFAAWVQDVDQSWSDTDLTTLNLAGINVTRWIRKRLKTMGYRSLASQTTDNNWSMFSNSRLIMVIQDDLGAVADNFEFSVLDDLGHTTAKFAGVIAGELLKYYENDDLFGATPDAAFSVDTGPSVNSIETMSQGFLYGKVALLTSPFAERVVIMVAKVPITEALPSSSSVDDSGS